MAAWTKQQWADFYQRNAERLRARSRANYWLRRDRIRVYLKEYRIKNADKLKASASKRRVSRTAEEREAERLYMARYGKRHAAKLSAKGKLYRANNLERLRVQEKIRGKDPAKRPARLKRNAKWRQSNREQRMHAAAKLRAKKKSIVFTITIDDIVIPELCPVFGTPLVLGTKHAFRNAPSLDRIDPKGGYTPDNIWVISQRANAVKNDGTPDEHEKIAISVRARLAKKNK